MRRSWLRAWLSVIVAGGVLSAAAVVRAQNIDRDLASPRGGAVSEREVLRALDEARRVIAAKQFHPAVQLLQSVLDRDEDFFVEQTLRRDGDDFRDDRDGQGGVKAVALKLLRELPKEGLAAYELDYGAAARNQLSLARDDDDFDQIATVARRFSLTAAGFEATVLLAARASDCNRPLEAALLLDTLQGHPVAAQKRTASFLLNVAACWHRAGRADRSLETLQELKRLASGKSLHIGGRDVTLFTRDDEAAAWLATLVGSSSQSTLLVESWAMPGGGATRNESAGPASPVGGDRWRVSLVEHLAVVGRPHVAEAGQPLPHGTLPPRFTPGRVEAPRYESRMVNGKLEAFRINSPGSSPMNEQRRTQIEGLITREQSALRDDSRIAFPAALPLVIGETVVYRTIADITAVQLRTGELLWRSSLTDGALTRLWTEINISANGPGVRNANEAINAALSAHVRRRLFRDAAAGTLSSDERTVFALEELDPSNSSAVANAMRGMAEPTATNKLVAYDLAGGRMLWEVGGPRGAKPVELSGHFFLGPPLPLDGRLYCLAEVQGDLRLLVLEQTADRSAVKIDWSQTLVSVDRPVSASPLRRLAGLSPSFADGILVCPTSSGAVIAIDIVRHLLLWGHPYTSTAAIDSVEFAAPMFRRARTVSPSVDDADEKSRWVDSLPLIAAGRAIVTPRDADVLLCLDLVDGRLLWSLPRGEWLYPACVVEGRVVLVGRDGLAAFQLSDGKPVDTFASIGVEPAGRGVRVGARYFLPLANGEIATVDLNSGRILARAKLSESRVPGNLIAGAGAIVSQSAGDLIAFAPLRDIETQIAEQLKADSQQAAALALRGELRLHRGDEVAGLADLRESLRRQPDPRVKSILAATLLAGLRGNVALVHDRAVELETLTDDPQQRNEFLRIYAKRLEEAGDRRGAFTQWMRMAETARFLNDLDPFTSSHAVRTDRVVRARLVEMVEAASPEEREVFDRIVAEHVAAGRQRATAGKATELGEYLEQSLRFFSGLPRVEQRLFEQVVSIDGATHPERLLERFAASTDLAVAAQAIVLLTRDLLQANRIGEAIPWIERLRDDFAEQKCLDNQTGRTETGRSLAEQFLKSDDVRQRLAVVSVWTAGLIDVSRKPEQQANVGPAIVPVEVVSRRGVLFDGWSFETDGSARILTARDPDCRVRWKVAIPPDAALGELNGFNTRGAVSGAELHVQDRWLALNFGTHFVMFQAVDPDQAPRAAWQQTLRPSGMSRSEMLFAQRGMRVRMLPNGQVVPLGGGASNLRAFGQLVGLTHEVAVYIVGQKLCAAELDSGRLAWSRTDVLPGTVAASVDETAVSIQPDSTRDITLLRTLDGADLAKRRWKGNDAPLWQRGTRRLGVQHPKLDERVLVLRDFARNIDVWNRPLAASDVVTVIDEQDVAILEATDDQTRVVVVGLADGREKYRAEVPLPLRAGRWTRLFIQRQPDRDIVLIGEPSTVEGSGGFDGHVCSVSRTDGKRLWTTPVKNVGFDRQQPTRSPVLMLVSQAGGAADPFSNQSLLSATLLDKRTGRLLYSTQENSTHLPPRLEHDPEHRRIVANFHGWQLDLVFPEPKP